MSDEWCQASCVRRGRGSSSRQSWSPSSRATPTAPAHDPALTTQCLGARVRLPSMAKSWPVMNAERFWSMRNEMACAISRGCPTRFRGVRSTSVCSASSFREKPARRAGVSTAPGRNSVDPHPERRHLDGRRPREGTKPALGRCVGGDRMRCGTSVHRADIDHRSPRRSELLVDGLEADERAPDIDRGNGVPLLDGRVEQRLVELQQRHC